MQTSLSALITLAQFLAPKLYPMIGCAPIDNPINGINRNDEAFCATPILASAPCTPISDEGPHTVTIQLKTIPIRAVARFMANEARPIIRIFEINFACGNKFLMCNLNVDFLLFVK